MSSSKVSDVEIREVLAFYLWSLKDGSSDEFNLSAAWRSEESLREDGRLLADSLIDKLESLGLHLSCRSPKKLHNSLDNLMTIPARKAYLLDA